MSYYEYRHRVGLEETNVVGNVYFTHYLRWQGRCREMFLQQHAPEVIGDLASGLLLATTRVTCNYYRELQPLDEVVIRMSAASITPSRLTMAFQYLRCGPMGHEELVAEGEQEVVCMRRRAERTEPALLPQVLRDAVEIYMNGPTQPSAVTPCN